MKSTFSTITSIQRAHNVAVQCLGSGTRALRLARWVHVRHCGCKIVRCVIVLAKDRCLREYFHLVAWKA